MTSRLTEHFFRSEFACRCGCGGNTVDWELLELLTFIRKHFNSPVSVHSGFRCPAHNAAVGGKENSYHLRGQAADISVRGILPDLVGEVADQANPYGYGIGVYSGFTHLDVRRDTARWTG